MEPKTGRPLGGRLGLAIPWHVVAKIGRVVPRKHGGKITSYQLDIQHSGDRWRLSRARVGDSFVTLATREIAEFVLQEIRSEASKCGSVARAVTPHLQRPDEASMVPRWFDRWIEAEEDRCRGGDISPRTLGELKRQRKAGDFDAWCSTPIYSITYGSLEDWNRDMTQAGRPQVMRKRILENFRRFLKWLERRGEIESVPQFPRVKISRKAPKIHTVNDQQKLLAAIPRERRGLFLAMAHTLRPQEARAFDLLEWRSPDLLVQWAMKGLAADAPRLGLKEADWRVVTADTELEEWICWRVEQLSPEEKLRREGVILFQNPSTGGRFSHHAITRTVRRATEKAGVEWVPPYAATKHTTATELIRSGTNPKMLQRFLGHADQRSTDAYVVLGLEDVKGLKRTKP